MKKLTVREIIDGEKAGTIKSWKAKELLTEIADHLEITYMQLLSEV